MRAALYTCTVCSLLLPAACATTYDEFGFYKNKTTISRLRLARDLSLSHDLYRRHVSTLIPVRSVGVVMGVYVDVPITKSHDPKVLDNGNWWIS